MLGRNRERHRSRFSLIRQDEVIVFTIHMGLRTASSSRSHRDASHDPVEDGNERMLARLIRVVGMPRIDYTCLRFAMVMCHYLKK